MSDQAEQLVHQYFTSHGQSYLDAERQLRPGNTAASQIPDISMPVEKDPCFPLLRSTLTGLQEGGGCVLDSALDHMDHEARKHAVKESLRPRVATLAKDLVALHGSRAAPYLAVRLIKQRDWPDWKIATVLHYLALTGQESALAAIARFESENTIPGHKMMIANALGSFEPGAVAKARQDEANYKSQRKMPSLGFS